MQVIKPQPSHAFSVLRPDLTDRPAAVLASGAPAEPRGGDPAVQKSGFFGFGRKPKKNSILMSLDQASGWGF